MGLPPGQRAREDFPRFGLDPFAKRIPTMSEHPTIKVVAVDGSETEVAIADFDGISRVEETSDFHCVTTWSTLGLRWGGWRFADIAKALVPLEGAEVIIVRGLDGYHARLPLEDIMNESVLVADTLDGEPLCLDHGAPLRLVAPRHYGYKNVKHVCAIECYRAGEEKFTLAGPSFMEHPRGRVDLEERGRLPARLLRFIYPFFVKRTVRRFRKAMQAHQAKQLS